MAPGASVLLHRLAEGDADALGELFDRYAGFVNALVLHIIPDIEAADEILQAVFLQAWHEAPSHLAGETTPVAWLCTMARSRALARLDSRQQAEGERSRRLRRSLAERSVAPSPGLDVC
jgi:DNA-directed RNA polymerase specialized sigma24 family protein